jgi:hypothetical protein
MPDTFAGLVIKIYVRYLDVLVAAETIKVHTEAVVLDGYFHLAGCEVFDGMVSTVMTEFQFVCFSAQTKLKHLMA